MHRVSKVNPPPPNVDIRSVKNTIQEGYLHGRAVTKLIDSALGADKLSCVNGKWYIGENEIQLNSKKRSFSMPFWIRRFFHHIRIHLSSSYKIKFEKTLAKIALIAANSGISPHQWLKNLENTQTRVNLVQPPPLKTSLKKASTSEASPKTPPTNIASDSAENCFSPGKLYRMSENLVNEGNVKGAFLVAQSFVENENKPKIFPKFVEILLNKEELTKVDIEEALDIALSIPRKAEFDTAKLRFLTPPCYRVLQSTFNKLVKKGDIENAFKIARSFLSSKEKIKFYPTFIRTLLGNGIPKKKEIELAIEIALYLPDQKLRNQCAQWIVDVANEEYSEQIRNDFGVQKKTKYEFMYEIAESGNVSATLLLLKSITLSDTEVANIYATLLKKFLEEQINIDEVDTEIAEIIINQIPESALPEIINQFTRIGQQNFLKIYNLTRNETNPFLA